MFWKDKSNDRKLLSFNPHYFKIYFSAKVLRCWKNIFAKFIFVILGKRRYNLPKDKDVMPAEIFMLLVERVKHLWPWKIHCAALKICWYLHYKETDGFEGKSLNVSILQFSQGHRKKWKIKIFKSFCFYSQSVLEQRLLKEGIFRVFDVTSFLWIMASSWLNRVPEIIIVLWWNNIE